MKKILLVLTTILFILFSLLILLTNLLKKKNLVVEKKRPLPTLTQQEIDFSRRKNSLVQQLKERLPYQTDDFNVEYSPLLDKFIITKKTPSADEKIDNWAKENNLSHLITNKDVFIVSEKTREELERSSTITPPIKNKDLTILTPAAPITQIITSQKPTLPLLATPQPMVSTTPNLQLEAFLNLINSFWSLSKTKVNLVTPTPTAGRLSSADISLGLPTPVAEGINGYSALKMKIESNQNALWATRQLLEGEKYYISKGGSLIKYLTTAWIWFENGASSWPDPYQINCNDDRPGYSSEVSFFCNVRNFQVAGYQAAERKNDYAVVFRRVYNESDLISIMQQVVDNSYRASRAKWSYKDGSQINKGLVLRYLNNGKIPATIGISDISPNKDFFNERTQFFSLILGKDPKMVVALNSFAVNSNFLNQLKNTSDAHKLYGYIGIKEVQLISNMIAALYIIDNGSL